MQCWIHGLPIYSELTLRALAERLSKPLTAVMSPQHRGFEALGRHLSPD